MNIWYSGSGRLQDDPQVKNDGCREDQAPATAKEVTDWSCSESSKEGSSREDGYDLRGLTSRNIGKAIYSVCVASGELCAPIWHGKNATDSASVITEQNASEGDEQAYKDSRPGRSCCALRLLEHDTHGGL